jgi:hypothetical protein
LKLAIPVSPVELILIVQDIAAKSKHLIAKYNNLNLCCPGGIRSLWTFSDSLINPFFAH